MNKKGFAITVILYAMVVLITAITFLLLGTVKDRYKNKNKIQEDIIHNVNIPLSTSKIATMPTCNNLIYNGENQELASGGNNIYLTNNLGKEIGTYSVKVHAIDYCAFEDGTNEKDITCTINAN